MYQDSTKKENPTSFFPSPISGSCVKSGCRLLSEYPSSPSCPDASQAENIRFEDPIFLYYGTQLHSHSRRLSQWHDCWVYQLLSSKYLLTFPCFNQFIILQQSPRCRDWAYVRWIVMIEHLFLGAQIVQQRLFDRWMSSQIFSQPFFPVNEILSA